MEILTLYDIVVSDIDEMENVAKFFSLLKHFNKGKEINNEIKENIE